MALYYDPPASRADVVEAEALLAGVIPAARRLYGPQNPTFIKMLESLEHMRTTLSVTPEHIP